MCVRVSVSPPGARLLACGDADLRALCQPFHGLWGRLSAWLLTPVAHPRSRVPVSTGLRFCVMPCADGLPTLRVPISDSAFGALRIPHTADFHGNQHKGTTVLEFLWCGACFVSVLQRAFSARPQTSLRYREVSPRSPARSRAEPAALGQFASPASHHRGAVHRSQTKELL